MELNDIVLSDLSEDCSVTCFNEKDGILIMNNVDSRDNFFGLTFKEGANLLLALKEFYKKFGVE